MKKEFDKNKTIFLVDGSTFLYRAYYGMKPLHTSKGVPIQAVYNFCRMIKKLINNFDPHLFAIVWDSKGPTKRKEIYPEYKAGRQAPPTDLFEQKDTILKFGELIGLPMIAVPGVEADDIIFSLTQDFKKDYEVVVIASDKDLYQILDDNVYVFDPFKDLLVDENEYSQILGFSVDKLPFYFALLGDASDNIPGVKGVGKTTALELVQNFDSIEDLYKNIEKLKKDRTKQLLKANEANAFLSYQLFCAIYHPNNIDAKSLKFDPNNWKNAKPLFVEYELKSLITDMQENNEKQPEAPTEFFAKTKGYKFKCVTTKTDLDDLVKHLKEKKVFAVDTELDGLDTSTSKLIGMSFCAQAGLAFYVPFGHKNVANKTIEQKEQVEVQTSLFSKPLPDLNQDQKTLENVQESGQLSPETVFAAIKPILEDPQYKKILHNAKFDKFAFYHNGINLNGISDDTMIEAGLIVEDWQRVGLKSLSQHYLNETMLTFEDVVKNKKLKDFSFVDLETATDYAAADSHQTFVIKEILDKRIAELKLEKVYKEIEMPVLEILFEMEKQGIFVDVNILSEIDKRLTSNIAKIDLAIQTFVNSEIPINLNSPKQIEELLFTKLNLPTKAKTGKGKSYSTDHSVLQELADLHPIPNLILKYRELYKLKSTYVDALPTYINKKTGKVHTTFTQVMTSTGRLSSYYPNLQNIPTGDEAFSIRSAFKPDEGYVFLSADYSQIELRILAYLSQDKNLINSFLNNEDVHTTTSAYIFGVTKEQVTSEQRQVGKRINFSVLYGVTPFGLSKDLKISMNAAKIYIDKYFEQYPEVLAWMKHTEEFAKEKGYVKTVFDRIRFVPGIYERNKTLFDAARRIAINMPAQGTAADIMKVGMINLDREFKSHDLGAKMLLQIHDELLIMVPKGQEVQTEQLVKKVLESVVNWNVPLTVTTRFGNDWQEVSK
ncbi:MAG: DNA polymerase I [Candidatus Babeliales bacterium]|nr:DNA polymerase I [Candidatus Babeliales bacterium]